MKTIHNLIENFDYSKCVLILNKLKERRLVIEDDKEFYRNYHIEDLIEDTLNMYAELVSTLNTDNEMKYIKQNYGLKLSMDKGDFSDYTVEDGKVFSESKYGIQFNLEYVPVWDYVDVESPKIDFQIFKTSIN